MAEADSLKWVVDEDDFEALAVGVGFEEGPLYEVVVRICENNVVLGNHVGCRVDNDEIGEGDALVDEAVNGLAKELFSVRVGHVDINLADLELKPPDGVSHGEAHGPTGCEIDDLRVEDVGGKVSRQGGSMGCCV